ncbi:MAG: FG-GAP-like repeat-containing protein [Burkholderiales bacterium]
MSGAAVTRSNAKRAPSSRGFLLPALVVAACAVASAASLAQTVTFTARPGAVISEPTIPKVIDAATGRNRVFPNLLRAVDRPGEVRPDILLVPGVNSVLPWVYAPVRMFRPSGDGVLSDVTRLYFGNGALPSTGSAPDVAIGDFNRDGRADFFITESGWDAPASPGSPPFGAVNVLLVSKADGSYEDRSSTLSQLRVSTFAATTADVDGDGIPDLYIEPLVPVPAPTNARLLMGRGDGTFDYVSATLPVWLADNLLWKKSFIGALLVDVDNDGYPDLVLGRFTAASLILLNDGTGDFSKREPIPLPGTAFGNDFITPAIASIDANGDGYADLVLVSIRVGSPGGQVQLLINRGDGTFADESAARLGPRAIVSDSIPGWDGVTVVDLNGDGKPDIVLQNGGTDFAWINDGQGIFAPVAVSTLPPNSPGRIVAADVDGDGVADLVALVYNGDGDIAYRTLINTAVRTVPSEPVVGTAVAGDAQATISFAPPLHAGASAIVGYTATCRGGSGGGPVVATGAGSPITVTGMVNGLPYFCTVTAANAHGTSMPSVRSNLVKPRGGLALAITGNGVSLFSVGVTLTATLSGAASATGTVNFRAFGKTIPGCGNQPVVASAATCATKALIYGASRIDAIYSGDAGNKPTAAPAVWHSITGGVVDITGLELPTAAAGSTRTVYLEPRNVGTAPLDLIDFKFTGPFVQTHSTCGSTLAPGQSCLLNVAYSPTATSGPIVGTLAITHTGYNSPFVATMKGQGTALAAPAFSGAFNPASVPPGNARAALTLTLRNPNAVALTDVKFGFNLPAQMLTSATPNAINACGGAWSVPGGAQGAPLANRGVLQFTGATIPAGGTCAMSIDVVSTATSGIHTVADGFFGSAEIVGDFRPFSLTVSPTASVPNYQGLWWNPAQSGWGINFAHQGDIIFATWFTYDTTGKPWWLIAVLYKGAGSVYSGTVQTVSGPLFNSSPFGPAPVQTQVGTMSVTFPDAKHGNVTYTVNGVSQAKAIEPQQFGPLPTCTWGAQANLALATNYTDLWWNASESGWGVNFNHQGDVIFATWFTYDSTGKPWWLIAVLYKSGAGVYSGTVETVTGPPFDTVAWDANQVVHTPVGTATVTFANGNAATFAYTVSGASQSKAVARQVFTPPGTACQ